MYVGLDISVNSTAMCVYNGVYNFFNYTTNNSNYVWIKKTSNIIDYRFLNFKYKNVDEFSDMLIQRIRDYDEFSDLIIEDLKLFGDNLIIGIEGYNYGLKTTDTIIDISELSAIIKMKLIKDFKNSKVIIIPPKSVKIETCKMVYKLIDKKKIIRNDKGIAGGSFDKNDMFEAFLRSDMNNKLKDYLISEKDNLLKMKNIPKPFDDIIDSIFIMEIVRKKFI